MWLSSWCMGASWEAQMDKSTLEDKKRLFSETSRTTQSKTPRCIPVTWILSHVVLYRIHMNPWLSPKLAQSLGTLWMRMEEWGKNSTCVSPRRKMVLRSEFHAPAASPPPSKIGSSLGPRVGPDALIRNVSPALAGHGSVFNRKSSPYSSHCANWAIPPPLTQFSARWSYHVCG